MKYEELDLNESAEQGWQRIESVTGEELARLLVTLTLRAERIKPPLEMLLVFLGVAENVEHTDEVRGAAVVCIGYLAQFHSLECNEAELIEALLRLPSQERRLQGCVEDTIEAIQEFMLA